MQPSLELLLALPILLLSVVLHEVAHGWVARREGDPTAERAGRITLNPMPHVDFMGTVLVPLLLLASGTNVLFGWAKPVPVNPSNFRDRVGGDVRVSLAGIATNLLLAAGFTLLAAAVVVGGVGPDGIGGTLLLVTFYGIYINLILAVFNLAPIPPLDGSHVVYHLLPGRWRERYRSFGRYGILVLMGVLVLVPGAFAVVLWPVDVLFGAARSVVGAAR